MDHLIQGQWAGSVTHLNLPCRTVVREVPGPRGWQDVDFTPHLLLRLAVGTGQPVLSLLQVTSNARVEPLARGTDVACAGQEEQKTPAIVAHGQPHAFLCIVGTQIFNELH
jgi:hypothetical protein